VYVQRETDISSTFKVKWQSYQPIQNNNIYFSYEWIVGMVSMLNILDSWNTLRNTAVTYTHTHTHTHTHREREETET
jgi:hypothetical protein